MGGDGDHGAAMQALQSGGMGGENAMGGDGGGAPGIEGENPMGSFADQSGASAPGKGEPASGQVGQQDQLQKDAGQQQGLELTGEDKQLVEAFFDPRQVKSIIERFGEQGIEYLKQQAQQKLVEYELGEQGGVQDGAQGDQPGQPAPGQQPQPQAQQPKPGDQNDGVVTLDNLPQEAIDDIRIKLGDAAYDQVVAPLINHGKQQATVVSNLINHFNGIITRMNQDRFDAIVDQWNDPKMGNSQEGLSREESALRKQVIAAAGRYRKENPKATMGQGLRFGRMFASRGTAQQDATRNIQAQLKTRQGIVGSVPARGAGGAASAPNGNGQQPERGFDVVQGILEQGMKKLPGGGAPRR